MSEPSRVGIRLRDLRRAAGWTQQELSKRSKVPRTTISAVEVGLQQNLRSDNLLKLAEALGVSLDVFIHGGRLTEEEIMAAAV